MKHFHQSFAPCFLRGEQNAEICMFFCLKKSFDGLREETRPPRERLNPPKHFVCGTFPFSAGLVRCQVHPQVKRGSNQGRHLSQNGGFIPAAKHTLTQSGARFVFPRLR